MNPNRSRRSFLRKLAGSAALLPVAARSLGELSPLLAATGGDEAYWQMVRYQFAFSEDKVPMNAGNLCPSPEAVAQRVNEITRDIDVDCSFQNRDKFHRTLEESRSKVAAQLGVSADEIALVRNTSEGNNTINNGLPLKAGDEIVLWEENHPTNNVAWDVRAARLGLVVKRVSLPQHPRSAGELVELFEKALTPKTRALAITHVSSASGMRLPAKELTAAAHRRGIYVHLDGAQSWGALHINLREIGCDSYAASAHKWFVGPKEVGMLYVKQERIAEIWPNVVAPGWGNDADPDVVGARKFESLGQRDDAALAAVATTAEFHNVLTPAKVQARMMELAAVLKAGLKDAGAKLVTPIEPELSGGVCIIEVPAKNRQQMLDRMYQEHGIAGSTSGGFRLCPHIYNTKEHVERAVSGVKQLKSLLA
jgi:selenocysteine lyase/cysteine desulfurase